MLTDKENTFCKARTLVGAVGAIVSEYIYLGSKEVLPGYASMKPQGNPLGDIDIKLLVQMVAGLDSAGGAGTVQVELVQADDDLGTNLQVLRDSGAIAEATAIAGYEFGINGSLPAITKDYLGLRITTAGEAITVGSISGFLVRSRQSAGR